MSGFTTFAVVTNPPDNTSLYDSQERFITAAQINAVTPPSGAWFVLTVARRGSNSIVMDPAKTGGQSWNTPTQRQTGSHTVAVFTCQYNGTMSGDIGINSVLSSTVVMQMMLEIFPPTVSTNLVSVDSPEQFHTFNAPVTPGDITATGGRTTVAASTMAHVVFSSLLNNVWTNKSGASGWANPFASQYRVTDPSGGRSMSLSTLTKDLTVAGATGNPVNEQTPTYSSGLWIFNVFKEVGAGVLLSSISSGSTPIINGTTGIVLTGTKSGASWSSVKLSPSNNPADAGAVNWPISSQTSTTITMGAFPGSTFGWFTNLFVFATDSASNTNSSGFVVQRGSVASFTIQLANIAGSANQSGLSGITWVVYPTTSVLVTAFDSGNAGTTDGSGNFSWSKTLADASVLNPATPSDVVFYSWKGNASKAATLATGYQITPSYS